MSTPDTSATPLVVLSFKNRLVGIHAHTGQRVWTFEFDINGGRGQLRVEAGRVFFIAKSTMFCLDYGTGALLWRTVIPNALGSEPNTLCYADCIVLMGAGEAASFAMADGAKLWHDGFSGFGIYGGAMAAPGVASPIDRVHS